MITAKIAYNKFLYYFIAQLTLFIIGIIKVPLYSSLFLPAEFGIYSWCVAFLAYIDLFFLTWVNATLWRYIYQKNTFHLFSVLLPAVIPLLIFSILLALLFIAFFTQFSQLNDSYNDLIIIGFFTIVSQQLLSLYLFFYQAYKNFKWWSFIIILQQLSTLALFFLFFYVFQSGIKSIFYASLSFNCCFILFYTLKFFSKLKLIFGRTSFEISVKYLRYSFVSILISFGLMILNNGERFIILLVKGEADLGLYAQYYGLATFGFFAAVSAFNGLMGPSYNAALVDPAKIHINLRIIELYVLVFTPITILLGVNSDLISKFLLDENYHGYSSVFTWTLIGLYFLGFYNLLETRMKFLSKLNHILLALGITALLNLGINYLLLPFFEFEMASIVSVCCYFLLFGYFVWINLSVVKQLHLKKILYDILLFTFLLLFLQSIITWYIPLDSLLGEAIMKVSISLILYCLLLYKHSDRIKEALQKFL